MQIMSVLWRFFLEYRQYIIGIMQMLVMLSLQRFTRPNTTVKPVSTIKKGEVKNIGQGIFTSHHHRHHHQPNSQTHHLQSKTPAHPPTVSSRPASNSRHSDPCPPSSMDSNPLCYSETLDVDQGDCIILHLHHFRPFPNHVNSLNRNHHLLDVTTVRSAVLRRI
jgi:hypothetical protein